MNTIQRPPFQNVSLADGLRWRPGKDWIFQKKLDGRWCVREFSGSVVIGEQMPDGFHAFDIINISGQNIAREPLRFRLAVLADFIREHSEIKPVRAGNGGEFLEAILRDGGEGVVAKRLSSPYDAAWFKCKRRETHDLVVTEIHDRKQSVRLGDRGWCSIPGRKFESVRVGDVIEVACHSIHASGRLREPVFVRVRQDKTEVLL